MDYVEIGEVADVAAGGCLLEMFNTFYDDRAVRLHVRKTRELISMAGSYSSASTAMAAEYELVKGLATERELGGDEKEEGEGKEGEGRKTGRRMETRAGSGRRAGRGRRGRGGGARRRRAKEKERREKEKERERKAKLPSSKARMEEIASLEQGVGLGDDPKGVLAKVMVKGGADEDAAPVCVESIAFSSFNPVPGPRRLQGDLVYLEVVTAEGKLFCVTAHTRGFFVNRSGSGRKLDPRPAEPKMDASTLIGLLRQISPLFSKAFAEVIERKANRHPFENMLAPLPPNDWAAKPIWGGADGTGPLQYTRDQIREAELKQQAEAEAAKKGEGEGGEKKEGGEEGKEEGKKEGEKEEEKKVETKEEKKEKRDKKKKEKKDKKEKEKKEQEAAAEEKKVEEAKAEEGDKKEGEKKEGEEGEKKEGEDAAAAAAAVTEAEQATYASSNNDLKGTMAVNNADIPGLYSLAMAIVDYRGHRVIAQSIIPGILYGDRTTQMLYGSVDTGKTIKWSDSFHPKVAELGKALHLKEHKVTDGDGKEATLCSPVETKGILGSDDRKYLLDLIRLTPRDANFTATTTSTTTAATGTDTNSTANAANAANAANRLAILRPELVEKFCREEQVERWMAQKGVSERPSAEEVEELREKAELPDVLFNPNVLTEFKLADDSKEVEEDEALVRKAGKYLIETALPALVADIKSSEGWPVDGRSLASTMHAHGVNLRYLGRVAKEVADVEQVYWLCVAEMVVRATKHVLKAVLRETLEQDVAGAIAHFLNCFLGTSTTTPPPTLPGVGDTDKAEGGTAGGGGKKKKKGKGGGEEGWGGEEGGGGGEERGVSVCGGCAGVYSHHGGYVTGKRKEEGEEKEAFLFVVDVPGYTRITADMVWSDITEGVKYKYQFEIPPETRKMVRSLATLRNICLKMGIVLAARDYNLECDVPIAIADVYDLLPQMGIVLAARDYNLECDVPIAIADMGIVLAARDYNLECDVPIAIADVCDLLPQVKFASPACSDAQKLLEKGKSLVHKVGLPLRPRFSATPQSGQWLREHETTLNSAFEILSEAYQILQQVCGPLHLDVAACCRYLALIFYHAGETGNAILQQHRELIINERVVGTDHPDTVHRPPRHRAQVGVCVRHRCGGLQGDMQEGRGYKVEAHCLMQQHRELIINERVVGTDHPDTVHRGLQQHLELIINERVVGTDHPGTVHSYGNMALYFHAIRESELALRHFKRNLLSAPLSMPPSLALCLPSLSPHPPPTTTTTSYGNMALYFHSMGESELALRHFKRTLQLLSLSAGNDHPEVASLFVNIALTYQLLSLSAGNDHPEVASLFVNIALTYRCVCRGGGLVMMRVNGMLQPLATTTRKRCSVETTSGSLQKADMGKLQNAMKYLQEAVRVSEKLLGENHVQVAVCHHALALAFSSMGAFKLALQEERKAQAVFEKAVGKEDPRTKESEQWVQSFLDRELRWVDHSSSTKESEQWVQSFLDRELRAQKQKVGQSAATVQQQQAAALRVAEALKQRPELLQVLQAAAAPGAGGSTSYQRAVADALLRGEVPPPAPGAGAGRFGGGMGATGSSGTGIRARGVDERASRAAAEARRKAAARGVNLRGAAGSAGARAGAPSAMDMEELINFINSTSPASGAASSSASKTGSAPAPAAGSAGGSAAPAGLGGVGLGVGVGAVSGAPPPTKAGGKKGAGAAAAASKPAATANGEASQGDAPLGLGGGLAPLPGGKGKGKAK
ncbi:unnamed protein product [Closterium sp. NIES-64]|nr:unnamed protein product [Closterium sp. NIES-64]